METNPLERAVEIAGGQAPLARRLSEVTGRKYSQSHVWSWLRRGRRLPAEVVIPIEQITEGQVTRHELRADIYPIEAA